MEAIATSDSCPTGEKKPASAATRIRKHSRNSRFRGSERLQAFGAGGFPDGFGVSGGGGGIGTTDDVHEAQRRASFGICVRHSGHGRVLESGAATFCCF